MGVPLVCLAELREQITFCSKETPLAMEQVQKWSVLKTKKNCPKRKPLKKLGEKYWQTQIFLKIITIWADVTIIFSEFFHDIHFTTY